MPRLLGRERRLAVKTASAVKAIGTWEIRMAVSEQNAPAGVAAAGGIGFFETWWSPS
jgi:hypothetical protein